ncbi:hypothetical protein Q3G72_004895 [Acer saccharum]|nr:hypothetical protein Q3G72_004895 [Acer saccharum]
MTSSSSSSSSATVAVDKATSELLMNPDWTMNIDICDSVNSHQWQAKDVVKAVKKRLQHKNAKVQLLALTLLETMVKNCGDYVHFQIAERNVLGEMVKIVKKKADMQVRDKILALLDSWQEAFGGPGGKHPQYYYACDDLRRSGVQFPKRSPDAAPIFTPPVTHPTLRHTQAGYGMPSNSSRRLDETMATEIETISLSSLDSMRDVMELLSDMLQAVNPSDHGAVKDEVILDLVNRCRSNQKKLMQMLTTTGDEELLGQGLELNDSLQTILAKYDAIAFGSPLPTQFTNLSTKPNEVCAPSQKSTEASDSSRGANGHLPAPVATVTRGVIDEEEEEEDDFAQLARRHSKPQPVSSQNVSTESSGALVPVNNGNTTTSSMPADSTATPSNALALPDPPVPVRTTKEQDMIDLLSITLSTTSTSPHTPHTPSASNNHSTHQVPTLPNTQGHPYASQTYPANQGHGPYSNYVAPWAQPQSQPLSQSPPQPQAQPQFQHPQSQSQFQPQSQSQFHPQSQPQFQPQSQPQYQPQSQPQFQSQSQPQYQPQSQPQYRSQAQPQYRPQAQPQFQPQSQAQYSQYSSAYPPPPWATTPGYYNNQNHQSTNANNMYSTPQANTPASYTPVQGVRPLQHYNSFPVRGSNGSTTQASSGPRNPSPTAASKPFIPSYRLFEDLNVLGNGDGRYKMTGSTTPGLSGTSGPSMVGGRK